MRMQLALLLCGGLSLSACNDTVGPSTGTLVVSTSTGGEDPDQDGYLLTVDDLDSLALAPTGTAEVDLRSGRHTLRLLGVAERCSAAPATSLQVDVPSGGTTSVAFEIGCLPTGVRVTTTTSGLDIDLNGYRVTVDGADRAVVPANGTVLTYLDAGTRTVTLTELTPNCTINGLDAHTVTIVETEITPIDFAVVCTATSAVIGVALEASGTHVDGQYEAIVDGQRHFPVGLSGPAYLTAVSAGDHVVSLAAPANCLVETGPQPVTVTVGGLIRDTVQVTFSVVCERRFGAMLAFVSDRDGDAEIYVMNTDGSAQSRLTNDAAEDVDPQWSPDREKIAFVSERDGNREIYVMNADGSAQTRLTRNAAYDDEPQWSPDGRKISFVSDRNGNYEIYVMNADGSAQTRLTNNAAYDDEPQWSPDGKKIAFVSYRDTVGGIYVMNTNGGMQTRLTNSVQVARPAWSPDGNRIAFVCYGDGTAEVCVMNASGGMQTRLTTGADAWFTSAAWSPDGQKIAFASGDILSVYVQICVVGANDGAERCLTRVRDNVSPVWSPDGRRIAFVSTRDGYTEIYSMNADGSAQTRLTNNAAYDYSPRYQP